MPNFIHPCKVGTCFDKKGENPQIVKMIAVIKFNIIAGINAETSSEKLWLFIGISKNFMGVLLIHVMEIINMETELSCYW